MLSAVQLMFQLYPSSNGASCENTTNTDVFFIQKVDNGALDSAFDANGVASQKSRNSTIQLCTFTKNYLATGTCTYLNVLYSTRHF